MIQAASIDLRGLDQMIGGLQNAFIARGRDGDASNILYDEASKLAAECAGLVGGKTLAKGQKKVAKDIGAFFHKGPDKIFEQSKRGGGEGIIWLMAGPNFLAGAVKEDFQPSISVDAMRKSMRNRPRRGPLWKRNGSHGKQAVMISTRILTSQDRIEALKNKINARLGRMKATFAKSSQAIAKAIGKNVLVPKWIARHFGESLPSGSALGTNPEQPSVEFFSAAPGVEKQAPLITKAIRRREHKIRSRIDRVLFGYAQDIHHGQMPKRNREADFNAAIFDSLN